jgi:hypothetical protein
MNTQNFKDLTLCDLFESEVMTKERVLLIIRSLEAKVLDMPERIEKANPSVDFNNGKAEECMIDLDFVCTDIYAILSMLRLCIDKRV